MTTPPPFVSTPGIAPHTHPSWCRGPAVHIVDPGTTLTPPRPGGQVTHPSAARLGVVAAVTRAVYAVLDEHLAIGPALLGPHVMLVDDLAIDSLDLLDVVIDLESAFGIVVPEREIDRLRTVGDLVQVVARFLWERDHPEPFRRRVDSAA